MLIVVEYEEFVLRQFTVISKHECGSIKVEIVTSACIGIPAKTYTNLLKTDTYALPLL
mgnify:CR=1 FL=1